jgi:hypothetical protein
VAVSRPRFTAIYPNIFEDSVPSIHGDIFVSFQDGIDVACHFYVYQYIS